MQSAFQVHILLVTTGEVISIGSAEVTAIYFRQRHLHFNTDDKLFYIRGRHLHINADDKLFYIRKRHLHFNPEDKRFYSHERIVCQLR